MIKVAIAIPDTGLFELPTNPTILEDTVAKKNPKTTIKIAPGKLTGITGISHITIAVIKIPTRTTRIGISCAVLDSSSIFFHNRGLPVQKSV